MAEATTASYEELVLEVEWVADSGTYSPICGLTGASITRSQNVTSTEVPDCSDESVPYYVQRRVRSIEVTVSGTGVWAEANDTDMKKWFYDGVTKNVRLRNTKVENDGSTGDVYAETGAALLTSLGNEKPDDKGVITASIELQFDGTPSLSEVA